MHQPANYHAPPQPGQLRVPYANFDEAKRFFPSCERTALRAFAQSEARRLANKLIGPVKRWPDSFINVVEMFADPAHVSYTALASRRFDFVIMLLKDGRLERRIARRLVREGKLSAEVLA